VLNVCKCLGEDILPNLPKIVANPDSVVVQEMCTIEPSLSEQGRQVVSFIAFRGKQSIFGHGVLMLLSGDQDCPNGGTEKGQMNRVVVTASATDLSTKTWRYLHINNAHPKRQSKL
jgi:hypothetical protein